jgi:uncharacterized coiled-coil protein SlyX
MNHDFDETWNDHLPPKPLRSARRRWPWLLLTVVLALSGSGVVYAWREIASLIPSLGHETPTEQMAASDKDALPDLLASQQKIEDDLAALTKLVTDQQEQVKTIVDQLAALTSKVDDLQRPAPPPPPPPLPAPVTADQPRASIAPTTTKPKKPLLRPSIHSGPVSVGGAPLNATPRDTAD